MGTATMCGDGMQAGGPLHHLGMGAIQQTAIKVMPVTQCSTVQTVLIPRPA